jgi:uncharacterized membrane-anchored protein
VCLEPALEQERVPAMIDRRIEGEALTKVPAVTLGFWIIKVLATRSAKPPATR